MRLVKARRATAAGILQVSGAGGAWQIKPHDLEASAHTEQPCPVEPSTLWSGTKERPPASRTRQQWAVPRARTPGTPGPCAKQVRAVWPLRSPTPAPLAPLSPPLERASCAQAQSGRPGACAAATAAPSSRALAAGLPPTAPPEPPAQAPWAPLSTGWTPPAAMWMRWTLQRGAAACCTLRQRPTKRNASRCADTTGAACTMRRPQPGPSPVRLWVHQMHHCTAAGGCGLRSALRMQPLRQWPRLCCAPSRAGIRLAAELASHAAVHAPLQPHPPSRPPASSLQLLLKSGADVDLTIDGLGTALHAAAAAGAGNAVTLLLAK